MSFCSWETKLVSLQLGRSTHQASGCSVNDIVNTRWHSQHDTDKTKTIRCGHSHRTELSQVCTGKILQRNLGSNQSHQQWHLWNYHVVLRWVDTTSQVWCLQPHSANLEFKSFKLSMVRCSKSCCWMICLFRLLPPLFHMFSLRVPRVMSFFWNGGWTTVVSTLIMPWTQFFSSCPEVLECLTMYLISEDEDS